MERFQYRLTLHCGAFTVVPNGVLLDRYLADQDRWQDVKSITIEPQPKESELHATDNVPTRD